MSEPDELERLRAERDALQAEVDRLHSWDGLMELLDEHWPEWLFPTLDDKDARDPGPRIVSLLRWVARLRAELDAVREVLSDEWVRGRVLPQMIGSADAARVKALHAILDSEETS